MPELPPFRVCAALPHLVHLCTLSARLCASAHLRTSAPLRLCTSAKLHLRTRARQFTYPPNLRHDQLLEVHCLPWPNVQVWLR